MKKKVKKPAGLKTKTCLVVAGPLGTRLGACPVVASAAETARRGICFHAGLENVKYCALGEKSLF
jgi:hypothetical protein